MVLQEPACGSKTLLQDMQEAYEKGLVSEEAITEAVERLMEVRIRLGMMKAVSYTHLTLPTILRV